MNTGDLRAYGCDKSRVNRRRAFAGRGQAAEFVASPTSISEKKTVIARIKKFQFVQLLRRMRGREESPTTFVVTSAGF